MNNMLSVYNKNYRIKKKKENTLFNYFYIYLIIYIYIFFNEIKFLINYLT